MRPKLYIDRITSIIDKFNKTPRKFRLINFPLTHNLQHNLFHLLLYQTRNIPVHLVHNAGSCRTVSIYFDSPCISRNVSLACLSLFYAFREWNDRTTLLQTKSRLRPLHEVNFKNSFVRFCGNAIQVCNLRRSWSESASIYYYI